jgi:hypothetical protein
LTQEAAVRREEGRQGHPPSYPSTRRWRFSRGRSRKRESEGWLKKACLPTRPDSCMRCSQNGTIHAPAPCLASIAILIQRRWRKAGDHARSHIPPNYHYLPLSTTIHRYRVGFSQILGCADRSCSAGDWPAHSPHPAPRRLRRRRRRCCCYVPPERLVFRRAEEFESGTRYLMSSWSSRPRETKSPSRRA